MSFAFPPAPVIAIPVMSSKAFPVRHIYCAGGNYPGGTGSSDFFMKPALSILPNGASLPVPPATADLQADVALVVALNLGGRDIPEDQAIDYIFGYAVGLDMTRRDLQASAQAQGGPWDMAKSFDGAAPLSAITPEFYSGIVAKGAITLSVNDTVRQSADLGDMLRTVPQLISALSRLVELQPGDLVFTGGPGPVAVTAGDRIEATIAGLEPLQIAVR